MSFAAFANAPATGLRQNPNVLGSKDILVQLEQRGVSKGAIAELLDLDPSRVTELYKIVTGNGKPRHLKHDEAVKLVEAFGLDEAPRVKPLPPAVMRLLAAHIASELGLPLEPHDPKLQELLADLQAFARFVSDPQVRESIEASEAFFRAMRLRRESAPEGYKENAPQPTR